MEKHENRFPSHLWEDVKVRFADVKSIKEYNSVRQDLIDGWVKEYEGRTYTVSTKDQKLVLPYYLHLVNCLDSSGLVVELAKKPDFKHENKDIVINA